MSVPSQIVVNVRKCDIQNGVPCDGKDCAVSRAVANRYHRSTRRMGIHTNEECVLINGRNYVPATKRDAVKLENFITNFDDDERRRYCRPMSVRLKLEESQDW